MRSTQAALRELRLRVPTDHGLTVFDAETQDTSYGVLVVDGTPLIFDTHRKDGMHVSTAELLTEVVKPVHVMTTREVDAFGRKAARHAMTPIPYSTCFFKGNLHVYAFHGPVRGFDIATIGKTVQQAEENLRVGVETLWTAIPPAVRRAQADLLAGRRRARYDEDLTVLRRKVHDLRSV